MHEVIIVVFKLTFYKQIRRETGKCPKVFENRLICFYTTVLVTLPYADFTVTYGYSKNLICENLLVWTIRDL